MFSCLQYFNRSDDEENDDQAMDMDDSSADCDYDPRQEAEAVSSDSDNDGEPQEGSNAGSPLRQQDSNLNEASGNVETGDQNDARSTARNHARTFKKLTRKRQRDPSTWKKTVRKTLRQSGQKYVDSRGKFQRAREIKDTKDCSKCKFQCSLKVSKDDRATIFKEFWSLDDNEKRHFYARTTALENPKRKRTDKEISRKKRSLKYFLPYDENNVRVCKEFYLRTLDVSQKRINNHHASKQNGGTPARLAWGKNKNNMVDDAVKESIRSHIKSIPRIESHYCRADTNKEYVSQYGLNVASLYRKYVEKCVTTETVPGKLHLYREIFNSEFNIAFHFPKTDRCDKCEEKENNHSPTPEEIVRYDSHEKGKEETRAERNRDRENGDAFVVCFDLENVFALPRANVGTFFYKRKLNTYNMTAHCSVNKKGYGAIWHEGQSGRGANDIASAVLKLLNAIVDDNADDPRLKHIILWSDSCVPQNRNRVFSTALKYFLTQHPGVKCIEQKFCEPGHSSIQEVDNLHSRIEKGCGPSEIYSPLSLMRILKTVNKLQVFQMREDDFKNFQAVAVGGAFDRIPYTKVKSLLYEQNEPKALKYKISFLQDFQSVNIFRLAETRGSRDGSIDFFRGLKTAKAEALLSNEKKKDLKSMLKFMPEGDRAYMSALMYR